MKAATSATETILEGGQYVIAELYDIQLASQYGSTVYHFTDFDVPISAAIYDPNNSPAWEALTNTYLLGLTIERGDLQQKIGTDGAELDVTMSPQWDAGGQTTPNAAADDFILLPGDQAIVLPDGQGLIVPVAPTGPGSYALLPGGQAILLPGGQGILLPAASAAAPSTGGPPMIGGYPFLEACRLGILDGATLTMSKIFFGPGNFGTTQGAVKWFVGIIGEVQAGRTKAELKASSPLSLMTVQMPRSLFQVGCTHTVYDPGCTLAKGGFLISGTVSSASSASNFNSTLTQADGYFSKAPGVLTFLTGKNAGLSVSVKQYLHASGNVQTFSPLPTKPTAGDAFEILPGCDHLMSTCANKVAANGPPFNNLAHFKGQPFIPIPETLLAGDSSNPPVQTKGRQAGQIIGTPISSQRSPS